MKRAVSLVALLAASVASVIPGAALADDLYNPAPATWGGRATLPIDAMSVTRDAAVTRARELLTRSRVLDEAAALDDKSATELDGRMPSLRIAAKAARDRAGRATAEERELLGARAEDLETDLIVSEAEVTFKRKTAVENRRLAKELRARAVRLVREGAASEEASAISLGCDPPFRFTADGRKIYRVECLK